MILCFAYWYHLDILDILVICLLVFNTSFFKDRPENSFSCKLSMFLFQVSTFFKLVPTIRHVIGNKSNDPNFPPKCR